MLLDHAKIMPYYFYMCDMIPNAEHWRLGVSRRSSSSTTSWDICRASRPRGIVCDVPFVGKRWVHQVAEYDRERGISYWTKNYRTGIEEDDRTRWAGSTSITIRSIRCRIRGRRGGALRTPPPPRLRRGRRRDGAVGGSRSTESLVRCARGGRLACRARPLAFHRGRPGGGPDSFALSPST